MPDDFSADISTTGTVAPGGSATGNIEVLNDRDWFAITLTAGQSYDITLAGGTILDTYLRVWDSAGTSMLAENDDVDFNGGDYSSALTFTATTSGTHYISAAGYEGPGASGTTGTYTINVTEVAPPGPVDSLDLGSTLSDTTVSYFFVPSGGSATDAFGTYTSEGFNAYEEARFLASFATIEAVTNLTFVEATTQASADWQLILDTDGDANGNLGWFNPGSGIGVFNGNAWDRTAGGSLEAGGYDFVTITHELLHGAWLDHPHDGLVMNGVTGAFGSYGDFNLNQGIFTTMSYNTGYETGTPGDPGEDWGYEIGPMALDIAMLQEKYGANTTTATGNDVYELADANVSGTGWVSIWDAGGTDEIRYTGARDAVIDLRAATLQYEEGGGGFVSQAATIAGGFTIAAGVVIENARGGTGDDMITGNDANNWVNAGRGSDTVEGGGGADRIIGAQGADTVRGGTGNDRLNGHNGGDLIEGGVGKDIIQGWNGTDTIIGGTENDVLRGGAHADLFIFNDGDGRDRIDDFQDNIDTLQLDAAMFTEAVPTTADLAGYASYNNSGHLVLTFDTDRIVMIGITDVAQITDDTLIIV